MPAAKADYLCSVSRPHVVEREAPARCPLTAHTLAVACVHPPYPPPPIHKCNKSFKKGWKATETPGVDLWPPHSSISTHVNADIHNTRKMKTKKRNRLFSILFNSVYPNLFYMVFILFEIAVYFRVAYQILRVQQPRGQRLQ